MNKYSLYGTLAVLGIFTYAFGVWSKITHQSYANEVLTAGLILSSIGLAAFVWLLFMWLKKRSDK